MGAKTIGDYIALSNFLTRFSCQK